MKVYSKLLFLLVSLMCIPAVASASLVIDNFSTGSVDLTVDAAIPSLNQTETGLGNVIGGARYSQLDFVSGGTGKSIELIIHEDGAWLSLGSDPTVSGTCTLRYGSQADPLAANLTSAGNAFYIVINTPNNATLKISVTTSNGAYNQTVAVADTSGADLGIIVPFSGFSGADFTDVSQLEFQIVGTTSGDYTVRKIAVPEPLSLAVLAAGSLLLARRRK